MENPQSYSYFRFIFEHFGHCGQLGDKDTFFNAVLKWMYKRPYEYALNKVVIKRDIKSDLFEPELVEGELSTYTSGLQLCSARS